MAADVSTDSLKDDVFIHCLDALSGLALLCAIWTVGQHALKAKRGQRKPCTLPCIHNAQTAPKSPHSHGRQPKILKRTGERAVSDDEASTSTGSSDSESDSRSSNDEGAVQKSPEVRVADPLRCRPSVECLLEGMSVVEGAAVSQQQSDLQSSEERQWENQRQLRRLRQAICVPSSPPVAPRPAPTAPTKRLSKKGDSKPSKTPCGIIPPERVTAATVPNVSALLQSTCAEDASKKS